MKYQLVLQRSASSINDYDALIEIEDALIEKLSEANDVDGRDAGSCEVNIFIRTNNPNRAFSEIKGVLANNPFWVDIRAAYREITGSKYTILWSEDLIDFTVT